jgi:hypothetical protein
MERIRRIQNLYLVETKIISLNHAQNCWSNAVDTNCMLCKLFPQLQTMFQILKYFFNFKQVYTVHILCNTYLSTQKRTIWVKIQL